MASLAWAAVAPLYARGLGVLARPLIGRLEGNAGTVYEVEGARLLAHRPVWLTRRRETLPLVQPLWVGSQNFGLPLLAALVLAVPGWTWRRRGRALAIGLAVLTLTQVAHLLVTIEATQQSPVMTAEGPVQLARYSPARQPLFYGLYYFFELMGRGFFALLVFAALVAFVGEPAAVEPAGRNDPCPCGSGQKFKRCHGR